MALPLGPSLRGLGSNPGSALDLTKSHNLSDSQFLPLRNGQDTASALQVRGWGEGFSLQQVPFLGYWTKWGQRGPEDGVGTRAGPWPSSWAARSLQVVWEMLPPGGHEEQQRLHSHVDHTLSPFLWSIPPRRPSLCLCLWPAQITPGSPPAMSVTKESESEVSESSPTLCDPVD